jgi:hypothetical protein
MSGAYMPLFYKQAGSLKTLLVFLEEVGICECSVPDAWCVCCAGLLA